MRNKKRRTNGGDFSQEQKEMIFKQYGQFCQICNGTSNLQVDHRFPQHICNPKTSSVTENAWVLCKTCNVAKGTKILIEVIKVVPRDILGPMLLNSLQQRIMGTNFIEKKSKVGDKLFTEIIIT
ncbi:HNH endonuclease [Exiguobacterium sp. s160]|uniref:HNH endonuclease n=1 Tax=Exiguobacterium sp. s160 TaxID=2751265 RepID=UPI001BEB9E81|nr:HNH endonuclease [Exiguobacterium sp. s160]